MHAFLRKILNGLVSKGAPNFIFGGERFQMNQMTRVTGAIALAELDKIHGGSLANPTISHCRMKGKYSPCVPVLYSMRMLFKVAHRVGQGMVHLPKRPSVPLKPKKVVCFP